MPDARSDLLLLARIVTLRSSLKTVARALQDLEPARHSSMPDLSPMRDLAASVEAAVDSLRDLMKEAPIALQGTAGAVINKLDQARLYVLAGAEAPSLMLQLDETVGTYLSEPATDLVTQLDGIEAAVVHATTTRAVESRELIDKAWKDYRLCVAECDDVFTEYVDLMRGVLLRDSGLDRDLCRVADEIVKRSTFGTHTWSSFSIPATHEGLKMSAAQLVRLGFPEWSVWSLPLVAREFGHIFPKLHPRLGGDVSDAVTAGAGDAGELCSWAADVFATSVMGSAYPCAAIVLRADPSDATDGRRVAVMLETLQLLGAPAEHHEWLAEAWKGASGVVPPLDDDQVSFVGRVKGRIRVPFNRWEEADTLVDRLKGTEEPPMIAARLQKTELGNVLVAAWQARIRLAQRLVADRHEAASAAERAAQSMDHDLRLSRLGDRTLGTCLAVIDATESGAALSPLPSPRAPNTKGDGGKKAAVDETAKL